MTAATLFPRQLPQITEPAGHIAVVLMNLFFSVRLWPYIRIVFPQALRPSILHAHAYTYGVTPSPSYVFQLCSPPPTPFPSFSPSPFLYQVTGAQGKLGKVLATAPRLFLFSAVQLLLHLAFLLGVGRGVFRLPLKVGLRMQTHTGGRSAS